MQSPRHTVKPARSFLDRILRITMPTLLYIALLNPGQLKLSSFIADKEQPATMGSSDSQTYPAQCGGAMLAGAPARELT